MEDNGIWAEVFSDFHKIERAKKYQRIFGLKAIKEEDIKEVQQEFLRDLDMFHNLESNRKEKD